MTKPPRDTAVTQHTRYISDAAATGEADALQLWSSRRHAYSAVVPLAEDLFATPASQACVERVFSLCGLLTAGRHNRMHQSLEMRAFLKLNKHISQWRLSVEVVCGAYFWPEQLCRSDLALL